MIGCCELNELSKKEDTFSQFHSQLNFFYSLAK